MNLKLATFADAENPIVGDLEMRNGNLVWTSDLQEEVVQRLRARFEFFKGEWYLDANEGTPYHGVILGNKGLTDAAARAIFANIIRTTPGISTLVSIVVVRLPGREMRVDFNARLEDGFLLSSRRIPPFIVRF